MREIPIAEIPGNISEVIHGKRKTAGGFIWKHA
jgi:hypothetical protein